MPLPERPPHRCADTPPPALAEPPVGTDDRDWRGAATADVIQHIVDRYHAGLREQLPELIRLARKVEARHGDRPECPAGLADHLDTMHQELEGHMQKEERVLFPMLLHAGAAAAVGPISVMTFEHEQHAQGLQRIEALTQGHQPPADACGSWRTLYAGLARLHRDLVAHITLENEVLFSGRTAAGARP